MLEIWTHWYPFSRNHFAHWRVLTSIDHRIRGPVAGGVSRAFVAGDDGPRAGGPTIPKLPGIYLPGYALGYDGHHGTSAQERPAFNQSTRAAGEVLHGRDRAA